MKLKLLFIACLLVSFHSVLGEFKELRLYGQMTYNLLSDFVKKNDQCTLIDLRQCLYGDSSGPIFKVAADNSYTRLQVTKCAYQISTRAEEKCTLIQEALRDEIITLRLWKNAPTYIEYGVMGFNTIVCFITLAVFIKNRREL